MAEDKNKKQLSNITQELGELSVETRKTAAASVDILKVSQETLKSIRGLNAGLAGLKAVGNLQLSEMRLHKVALTPLGQLSNLTQIRDTLEQQLDLEQNDDQRKKKAAIDENRKGNPLKSLSETLGGLVKRLDPVSLAKAFAGAIPKPSAKGAGGLLKSLGKAGLIIGGLGLLAVGGAALFQAFEEFDATKVTDNVKELLSIGDKLETSDIDFLKEGGKFGIAMSGIGIGLGLFGIGSAFAGASAKWLEDNWASKVVDNVTTLLGLNDLGVEDYSFLKEGGKLGFALGGIGIGLGLFGIGSTLAGTASKWTEGDGWAEKVVDNVKTLLQIGEVDEKKIKFLDGAGLAGALGAIGLGLVAFAAGEGIAAAITFFTDDGWAENVVSDVKTLLQLGDEDEKKITALGGLGLGVALAAIGTGLVAFAAGEGIASAITFFTGDGWADNIVTDVQTLLSIGSENVFGLLSTAFDGVLFAAAMSSIAFGLTTFSGAEGIQKAVEFFGKEDWAQTVVDNVDTLLGMVGFKMAGESFAFLATMTAIGTGLVAFTAGEGIQSAVEYFSKSDWAQTVVDNVETLLSIVDLKNMSLESVSGVSATMAALGAGLAAFGIGQAVGGIGEAINKFASPDEDFADRIKRQVKTLLSIPELMGEDPIGTAKDLKTTLSTIGEGIAGFGSESFVDMLKNAGEAILGFFGVESPFSKILSVAENAKDLEIGANAVDKLVDALERLKELKFKMPKVNFDELAKQLGRAVPLLRAATSGGIIDGGFFGETLDFGPEKGPGKGGILDPDLNLDELSRVVGMFTGAMSGQGYSVGELKTPTSTFDFSTSSFPKTAGPSGNISGIANEAESPTERLIIQQEQKRDNDANNQGGGGDAAVVTDNSSSTVNNVNTNFYQDVNTPTADYTDWTGAFKAAGTR